jgi:hypothetical protein
MWLRRQKTNEYKTDREIICDLLLHDPEVRELLKKVIAEISSDKT